MKWMAGVHENPSIPGRGCARAIGFDAFARGVTIESGTGQIHFDASTGVARPMGYGRVPGLFPDDEGEMRHARFFREDGA